MSECYISQLDVTQVNQDMKAFLSEKNKNRELRKELNKLETTFAEGEKKMNSLEM